MFPLPEKGEVPWSHHQQGGDFSRLDESGSSHYLPTPESGTEMKRFLGLCSYFIPTFADVAQPLYHAAGTHPFTWTPEAEEAFKQLQLTLTGAAVLAYPDPDVEFISDTNASHLGLGAVLSQEQGREERVISVGCLAGRSRTIVLPGRNCSLQRRPCNISTRTCVAGSSAYVLTIRHSDDC